MREVAEIMSTANNYVKNQKRKGTIDIILKDNDFIKTSGKSEELSLLCATMNKCMSHISGSIRPLFFMGRK